MAKSKKSDFEPLVIPENAGSFKLREHQEDALFYMNTSPNLLIWAGMGSGKTCIAIEWIRRALKSGLIEDALIVVPASLQMNWRRNIDKHLMFEGVTVSDILMLRKAIKIVSYQKTYKMTKREVHHRNGLTSYKKEVCIHPDIDKLWGVVFYDESQGIGSHSSIQTKTALALRNHAYYRYLLSATPIHGGGGSSDFSKLYGQMEFLDPGVFGTWTNFVNRYVINVDRWHNPIQYNVAECTKVLTNHAVVYRTEDLLDLPDRNYIDIPCELAEPKVYKDIKKHKFEEYGFEPLTGGAVCQKLLQICSGSMKRDAEIGGPMTFKCSKDEVLADILNGTDGKVVVFCTYSASIDRVMSIAKKCGRDPLRFDGTAKPGDEDQFQNGKKDLICAQVVKGGAGLDLFSSSVCVFFEPCFSALQFEQAHGRIWREGQTKKCTYYYLFTPGTFEEKALKTVREGRDVTNKLMEEWVEGELDFDLT